MVVKTASDGYFTRTAMLSRYQMPGVISVADVIRVLNKGKISFVLVGAYGLAEWRKEARGTEDVDVVVAAKQLKKAVRLLTAAFPQLEPADLPDVIRLKEHGGDKALIDIVKPVQQPYCDVFKHTHTLSLEGHPYRIPTLEMGLVMKFAAMTSLYRAVEDKYRDAHDFIRMVKNNPIIAMEKLSALGSLIYPDGGPDALAMVRRAKAGETLPL
jgi:hypothetical protein